MFRRSGPLPGVTGATSTCERARNSWGGSGRALAEGRGAGRWPGNLLDLLGAVETLARTPFDELQAPYGPVRLISPEDLLVERILVSVYPQRDETANA